MEGSLCLVIDSPQGRYVHLVGAIANTITNTRNGINNKHHEYLSNILIGKTIIIAGGQPLDA